MGTTGPVVHVDRGHFWPLTIMVMPLLVGLAAVSGATLAAQFAGALAGASLLVASVLFYFGWRLSPVASTGWLVISAIVMSSQLFVTPVLAFTTGWHPASSSPLLIDTIATAVAVTFVLIGARPDAPRCPDPVVLGLGVGLALVMLRLLLPSADIHVELSPVLLAGFILGGHLVMAAAAVRDARLPLWAASRLAVAVVLLGATQITLSTTLVGPAMAAVIAAMCATAAAAWASAAYVLVRDKLENAQRRAAALEATIHATEESQRTTREQFHELRSTVSGLANAARLAGDPRVDAAAAQRLHDSIRTELARLERLLSLDADQHGTVASVDLDASLDSLLTLHRARGRQIEWTPSGLDFVGQQDAVKEAVNILLDNAVVHGGTDGARIDVREAGDAVEISVTDDGPGVPDSLREEIFAWGKTRPGSPGQGIGLNVAQRLVAQQGGSLSLCSPAEGGSSFVINLPRVRQSQENLSVPTEPQPS